MKKILFIILSIFCFIGITNARSHEELVFKWDNNINDYVYYFEEVDDHFFIMGENYFYIQTKDGKKSERITDIKGKSQKIVTIGDKYVLLTNEYVSEKGYTQYIYVLNKKYEIEHSDELYTGGVYLNNISKKNNKNYLGNYATEIIELDSTFNFIKPNEDSDGNYTIVSNNKIVKISKNNQIIYEINGSYTAKTNDYYYRINYAKNTTSGYDITVTQYDLKLEELSTQTTNTTSNPYNYYVSNDVLYIKTYDNSFKVNASLGLDTATFPTIEEVEYYDFYPEGYEEITDLEYDEMIQNTEDNLPENGEIDSFSYYKLDDGSYITAGIFDYYDYTKINFAFLMKFDSNGNLKFNKTVYAPAKDEYHEYNSCSPNNIIITELEDYIYVLYDKYKDYKNMYLAIYDLEGNLKDTKAIETESSITSYGISKTKNGLLLYGDNRPYGCDVGNKPSTIIPNYLNNNISTYLSEQEKITSFYYYEFPYNITTKSDGNGTITATKVEALSGEVIEYEVKPKEGYVLGEIKVIDEDGNILTFTDNKFTMPSSNVTIEATFVVENVDTADIAICTILILGLIGIFFIVSNKTKINYINN